MTKFTSGGGAGKSTGSIMPIVLPPPITLIETHWKNFLNELLSMLSSVKTLWVSCFNGPIFAFGPAAHATMFVN